MKEEYNVIHKCRACGQIIKKPLFIPVSNQATVIKEILITVGTIPNDTGHQPIEKHDICMCADGMYGITDLIGVERCSLKIKINCDASMVERELKRADMATGGIYTGPTIEVHPIAYSAEDRSWQRIASQLNDNSVTINKTTAMGKTESMNVDLKNINY